MRQSHQLAQAGLELIAEIFFHASAPEMIVVEIGICDAALSIDINYFPAVDKEESCGLSYSGRFVG
jgi:hypothetical protein